MGPLGSSWYNIFSLFYKVNQKQNLQLVQVDYIQNNVDVDSRRTLIDENN